MTVPITGDATALRRAAGAIEAAAGDLASHRGDSRRARHAALAQWDGSASMAFGGTMASYATDVDRHAAALTRLAAAVRTYAGDLEHHQSEDRRLRGSLLGAEHEVRVLRHGARTAVDPISAAQTAKDLGCALQEVRTIRGDHDALWVRHRRSLATLSTALERANPPERLWHEGARRLGLTKTTITALTKGRAVITVLRLDRKPELTETQAAKHAAAAHTLKHGFLGSLPEKTWVNKVTGDGVKRAAAVAGPLGTLFFLYDSMKPGIKDVRTGGGYTGWRDAGTRMAGLAQIAGVVAVRFPYTRGAGAAAIGAWVIWKSANSIHDNDDWVNTELPGIVADEIDRNVPAVGLAKALLPRYPDPSYRGRITLDPALRRALGHRVPPARPAPHNPVFDQPDWAAFSRERQYGPPTPPTWQQRLALAPRRQAIAP